MTPENADLSEDNAARLIQKNKNRDFLTNLNVFKNHNGLRLNCLHLLTAPTGVGKSTFVRTMVIDFIINNSDKKILLWLTEETKEDFEQAMAHGLPRNFKYKDVLHVMSEQSLGVNETGEDVKRYVSEAVDYYKYDLVILDNVTTSKLYLESGGKNQEYAAAWLKSFCKNDLALFVIAHTGSGVANSSGKLIDENDIRGNKTLPNLVEFMYVLQPFYVGEKLYQVITLFKSRNQDKHGRFVGLTYLPETKTFRDEFIPFDKMKEMFSMRNQLENTK
tara:strand:+ start:1458 stop:2285 length:828 start_codon:yes stop_codon:yes gene_type:complete